MKVIFLFCCILLSMQLLADELVIIQTVSGSGKTFVIAKGRAEGIYENQESIFSSPNSSIRAKVVQASRHFSLWKTTGNKAKVPFRKNQYVNYSPNIERIWSDLSRIATTFDNSQEDFANLGTRHASNWLLRGAVTNSFSESVSGTDPTQASSRTGLQAELLYGHRLANRFQWFLGLRYDRESITVSDPALVISTYRVFGNLELHYHFPNFTIFGQNTYLGVGLAAGQSSTQNSDQISSGLAFAVPVRLGLIVPFFAGYSLTIESVVESVYVKEKFKSGEQQSTTLINGKIALGLKF